MAVDTIIFDLDDTLLWDKQSIQSAFDETCKLAEATYTLDPKVFEQAVREEATKLYQSYAIYPHTVKIGINPFEGLWGTFDDPTSEFQEMHSIIRTYQKQAWQNGLQRFDIEDERFAETLAATFIEERIKHPYLYEDTIDVLNALKGRYKLVLLTNGAPSLQNTKLKITPQLVPYFDRIVISGDFGVGKPDPSIFEHVVQAENLDYATTIMVGDNLNTDILGSNRVGMRNVWINREHKQANSEVPFTYEIASLSELLELLKEI
jgi:putative hydrolase of the HAD superfamily